MKKFTFELTAKTSNILKNASNKRCTELNLLQKTRRMQIFIYPWSRARALQRFSPISVHFYTISKTQFCGDL